MAEEKPSPVTYHEYDIPGLNSWFAWSAALLLVVSLWMIWADYSREWKDYQRRFVELESQRTRAQLAQAEKSVDRKKLEAAQKRLQELEAQASARRADRERLAGENEALLGKWYAADQKFRFAKAELDVARFELDDAKQHGKGVKPAQEKFDRIVREVEERRVAFEELEGRRQALERDLAAVDAGAEQARLDIEKLREDERRLRAKLDKLTGFARRYFVNQPLVDFMAPTIKVNQVILPDLQEDVNFMTVPRVDRCHTCHLAIDKPGYTGASLPPEFRTHPRLETLLGRNHPVDRFGCTGCHGGSGRAITFVDAAHTPRDAKQAAEWQRKYGWHKLHHWDFPMLPLAHTESNCASCHRQETRIPGADRLNAGRQALEDSGCFGCHKIDWPGFADLRKVGPDLARLQGKVTRDWAWKWISEPRSFRPSTRMPRIWHNSNTDQPAATMNYPLRDQVEIEAVTRHLMTRTAGYPTLPLPSGKGDPARGKWVVDNRGCKACHVVGPDDKGDGRARPFFGPELNQVGSKLTLEWLYAWIRDPQSLWPGTKMPNLRLSDQEALDAASYLLTLRNPDFEAKPVPDPGRPEARKMLEDVTYEYLRKELTTAEAKQRLAALDEDGRYAYLGPKIVARYGCFGCHDGIPGFESAQRIGTELTTWSSKLLTQLDFGLLHDVPHTKHDWLRAKLADPRIFDEGKVDTKDPQDLLKMPNFLFSDEQIEQVMTAVLSFRRDLVAPGGQRRLDATAAVVEKGRRRVRENNCHGCHVVEDTGGGMERVLEGGKPYAPPVLVDSFRTPDGREGRTEQGAKTQPDWMFAFLKEPSVIRPWLNVRMPTFGLTDEEASDLVKYFADRARQPFPYTSFDPLELPDDLVAEGQKLFTQFQCVSCHLPLEEARARGVSVDQLAPNLELTKRRLRYDWLREWLRDPGAIQQDTKMPAFFYSWDEESKAYVETLPDAERKIEALRAYLQFHGGRPAESSLAAAAPAGRAPQGGGGRR